MLRELLDAMPAAPAPSVDDTEPPRPDRLRALGEHLLAENLSRMAASRRDVDAAARLLPHLSLALVALGLLAVVAGLVRGVFAPDAAGGLAVVSLAGLGAVAFAGTFALRPLAAPRRHATLQREAIYASWQTAAMNSYWARIAHLGRPGPVEAEIKRATDDLICELTTLLEKQGSPTAKRSARGDLGTGRRAPPGSDQV
jgi:hypothetical protein